MYPSLSAIRRCSKLVATIGPATSTLAALQGIIDTGGASTCQSSCRASPLLTALFDRAVCCPRVAVDVVRLNFSHGSHAEHAGRIELVREAAEAAGRPVALLQDLCGPKIRTGKHKCDDTPLHLKTGSRFTIVSRPDVLGYEDHDGVVVGTTYEPLASDVAAGDTILISDGNLCVRCVDVKGDKVVCDVVHGGLLKGSQGLNLPGVDLSTSAITDKDVADLAFGMEQQLDFVALSFVRCGRAHAGAHPARCPGLPLR